MSSFSSVHIIFVCCVHWGVISDLSVHFIWQGWPSCSLHLKMTQFCSLPQDVTNGGWGYILLQCAFHLKSLPSCSLHLKMTWILLFSTRCHYWGYLRCHCTLHLKSWPSCSLHLKLGGIYLNLNTSSENMNWFRVWVSVCTSSEQLTKLFTSSETGGYILSQCALHLTSWPSCSLHLKTWHNSALFHEMSLLWGISDLSVHFIWQVDLVVQFFWKLDLILTNILNGLSLKM